MNLQTYLAECDPRYSEETRMLGSTVPEGHYHCGLPPGSRAHHTRESLMYAIALLESNEPERRRRAVDIIAVVLTFQDPDPTGRTYGIWPMYREEPLDRLAVPDWNYADFIGSQLVHLLATYAEVLPDGLVRDLRVAIGHAAWSIFRRNMGPHYTNIAFSGGAVTAAVGELLGEDRLVAYARIRLNRIVEYTRDQGGFNEYNSPGYGLSSLRWCEWIHQYVGDEEVRLAAESLRRIVWQAYAEHYHPPTGQLAGPHSRSYTSWLPGPVVGYLREQTGLDLVFRGEGPAADEKTGTLYGYVRHLPVPPDLVERFRTLPRPVTEERHRYIRRETEEESVWGTTWFTGAACLGSVNHDNLWTQRRPLLAYWKTPEDPAVVFRVRFLRNGRDFASAYIHNTQQGCRVLSLVSLLTDRGDWHTTIDRPEIPGLFSAEDFRLRYELTGRGISGRELEDGRFELTAGSHRAVIHTAPGRFGPHEVRWELDRKEGEGEEQVVVDGICYDGPRREFQFQDLGEVVLAAAVELLQADEAAAQAPIQVGSVDEDRLEATWQVGGGIRVEGPGRAQEYV